MDRNKNISRNNEPIIIWGFHMFVLVSFAIFITRSTEDSTKVISIVTTLTLLHLVTIATSVESQRWGYSFLLTASYFNHRCIFFQAQILSIHPNPFLFSMTEQMFPHKVRYHQWQRLPVTQHGPLQKWVKGVWQNVTWLNRKCEHLKSY